MSSRLPTRAFSRSVSSSIVSRNSCRASGVQSTSSLEQARDRRLDRGERRAQVVRDGREDRGAELVRRRRARRPPAPPPRARRARPRPRAPWRTRRGRAGPRRGSAGRRARGRARRRARSSPQPASGLSGIRSPLAASIRQPLSVAVQDGGAVERRAPDGGSRAPRRPAPSRRGARAPRPRHGRGCPRPRACAARSTKPLTMPATARKTASARMFSPSLIVNV